MALSNMSKIVSWRLWLLVFRGGERLLQHLGRFLGRRALLLRDGALEQRPRWRRPGSRRGQLRPGSGRRPQRLLRPELRPRRGPLGELLRGRGRQVPRARSLVRPLAARARPGVRPRVGALYRPLVGVLNGSLIWVLNRSLIGVLHGPLAGVLDGPLAGVLVLDGSLAWILVSSQRFPIRVGISNWFRMLWPGRRRLEGSWADAEQGRSNVLRGHRVGLLVADRRPPRRFLDRQRFPVEILRRRRSPRGRRRRRRLRPGRRRLLCRGRCRCHGRGGGCDVLVGQRDAEIDASEVELPIKIAFIASVLQRTLVRPY